MPEPTTSAPASLPRADSTRLTAVQVAERLNVSASTWRSYVATGQAPQRTDASTPAHRGGTAAPSTSGRRVARAAAHEPLDVPYTAGRRIAGATGTTRGAWTAAPSSRLATAAPTTVPSWRARSA